jgi:hypothetical protein
MKTKHEYKAVCKCGASIELGMDDHRMAERTLEKWKREHKCKKVKK